MFHVASHNQETGEVVRRHSREGYETEDDAILVAKDAASFYRDQENEYRITQNGKLVSTIRIVSILPNRRVIIGIHRR